MYCNAYIDDYSIDTFDQLVQSWGHGSRSNAKAYTLKPKYRNQPLTEEYIDKLNHE